MYFFQGGYSLYLCFTLPALLLGLWAQAKVRSAFTKYSRIRNGAGISGMEVAQRMMMNAGISDVSVEQTRGMLSDHYDPSKRVLRLSPEIYGGNSIAAAGVAAHEAGHAIQHAEGSLMLQVRSAMVPSVQIGSWLGPIIFIIGLLLQSSFGDNVALVGLGLFGLTALFAVITLPVEIGASRKAKAWLATSGVIYEQERPGINRVLDAAALTYVAAAIQAISTLLYYAFLLFGRRRD